VLSIIVLRRSTAEYRVSWVVGTTAAGMVSKCHRLAPPARRRFLPFGPYCGLSARPAAL